MTMAEQLKLFEMPERITMRRKPTNKESEFLNKFKPKNGSDECYTPPEVFEVVKNYVFSVIGGEVDYIRPFKPNGDFTSENYDNKIVIDNPPYSIISKIIQWYNEHNIRYFLFCNHLTSTGLLKYDCTILLTNAKITYANGAKVNTDFVTNIPEFYAYFDTKILLAGKLLALIDKVINKPKNKVCRFARAMNAARMGKYIVKGHDLMLSADEILIAPTFVQNKIFGGAFYIEPLALKWLKEDIARIKSAEAETETETETEAETETETKWLNIYGYNY